MLKNDNKIDEGLIERVKLSIVTVYWTAREKFNREFPLPEFSFELKSQRVGGRANYDKNILFINPQFLLQETEKTLSEIVPHEAAHLINGILYPKAKQHHGPEWKYVMRKLGQNPSRFCSFSIRSNEENKIRYEYICPVCFRSWFLSPIRHKRTVNGEKYYCSTCDSFKLKMPLKLK